MGVNRLISLVGLPLRAGLMLCIISALSFVGAQAFAQNSLSVNSTISGGVSSATVNTTTSVSNSGQTPATGTGSLSVSATGTVPTGALAGATGTTTSAGAVTCTDSDLQKNLGEASVAYINGLVAQTRQLYEQSPRTDLRQANCLDDGFFKNFDLFRALIEGVIKPFAAMLDALLTQIISQICDYVNNAINAVINSVLSYLCIPGLPGLPNLIPGFGSISGRSCNGTPLLSYGSGGYNTGYSNFQFGPGYSRNFTLGTNIRF